MRIEWEERVMLRQSGYQARIQRLREVFGFYRVAAVEQFIWRSNWLALAAITSNPKLAQMHREFAAECLDHGKWYQHMAAQYGR